MEIFLRFFLVFSRDLLIKVRRLSYLLSNSVVWELQKKNSVSFKKNSSMAKFWLIDFLRLERVFKTFLKFTLTHSFVRVSCEIETYFCLICKNWKISSSMQKHIRVQIQKFRLDNIAQSASASQISKTIFLRKFFAPIYQLIFGHFYLYPQAVGMDSGVQFSLSNFLRTFYSQQVPKCHQRQI